GGAYGHRVGHSIAFAYIEPSMCSDGEKLTVETSLGKRKCHVISEAVYDSGNNKLLS
ncbi:MAG: glycine cleavage T C-terminal barrel domain-containing protein, partial [Gammaproteobacteria bacterium]|nr:glycine cleavage T C-terminal barrel domain-containing protein [Gammaproteobacteria bacterium]